MIRNGVHISFLIAEGICAIFVTYLVKQSFKKYQNRRNQSTFDLTISFLNFTIAIWLITLGRVLDYFSSYDAYNELSFVELGLSLSFMFLALANIWLAKFVVLVFMKENTQWLNYYIILNGITIGLFMPHITMQPGTYRSLVPQVIYHALISVVFYIKIVTLSYQEIKNATDKLVKIGFKYISLFGIFLIGIFIFTALDVIMVELGMIIASTGSTVVYYFIWISAMLSILFGYLGYMMPDWLKNKYV
ncbi:MAG: hypothetical protein OEZ01_06315 [Candidatus Heimdallarchaeota archaeon]|nr:hypothetical protein [Candidatus Heimdallarchaeota archaeon]